MLFWPWTDTSKKIHEVLDSDPELQLNTLPKCDCEGGCSIDKYTAFKWSIYRLLLKASWFVYYLLKGLFPKMNINNNNKDNLKQIDTAIKTNVDLSDVSYLFEDLYKNSEKERDRILEDLKNNNVDLSFLNDNIKK